MSKPECLAALIALILYASAWSIAAVNPSVEDTARAVAPIGKSDEP